MAYIYGIQNKINKKWYIGQSKYYPTERWRQHAAGYKNTTISKAIKKYGADSFDYLVLLEVHEDELDEKEKEFIALYDSFVNGYNETRGGVSPELGCRLAISPQEVVEYYVQNEDASCRDVAKHFGIFHETVSAIITEAKIPMRHGKRPVVVTDIRTGKSYSFGTYMDASKFIIENNPEYPRSPTTVRKHLSKKEIYRDYKITRLQNN